MFYINSTHFRVIPVSELHCYNDNIICVCYVFSVYDLERFHTAEVTREVTQRH